MKIKFGTSGWRGVIAKEFTWEKVNRVADAIAVLLQREGHSSIVIGGDCRFLSPELAESTALRMSEYGFHAILADRPTPTPVLSHACRLGGHGGVINFTASHNPPLYNGIKFSPSHGGPAGDETTNVIEELIEKEIRPSEGAGSVSTDDLLRAYTGTILDYLDEDIFRQGGLRVVYDAFSGAGSGLLDRILVDLGAAVRVINGKRDPLFAGRQHPEPGIAGTVDLASQVIKSGASLGIATDGDADRFGLIDENGCFVSPHDYLPLLLEYLIKKKGMKGLVLRSVTTGSLIDRVAHAHSLEIEITPVGFKYLGGRMLETDVILAGEESGGLSVKGHIPEKDGVLACLLAAEMVCARGKGLAAQLEELWLKYGRVHVSRIDLKLDDRLREFLIEHFFESIPSEIAGSSVKSVDHTDGVRFLLENDSWVLIRLSGTEPLARIYAQADTPVERDRLLNAVIEETDAQGYAQ
ncbi:MAG: phosphoglucomutase/phosphomannomutase family protein [Candidatus Aegiribacteria sp.]|nr:phosphoglucomutase/phosphomannomutase family protein [Candidatus Aegiribacteria sp.]